MEEFGQHYTTINHDNNERRLSSCDQFIVEDLLDFSHEDGIVVAQDVANNISPFDDHHQNYASGSSRTSNSNNSDSSTVVTPVDSCNSSFSGGNNDPLIPPPADIGSHFSAELGVPYDEFAQLEWLSNFVEESFSSEDLHKFHQIPNISAIMKARPNESFQARYNPSEPTQFISTPTSPVLNREVAVPGKARSKRSRAAPCNWASRLLVVSPGAEGTDHETINKPAKPIGSKKKVLGSSIVGPTMDLTNGGEVRKCLHCATDKTPQWRSGPMGPKTLCNACGVRYKSGRLVPEYRPAASPTFMLTKHSNSHRKVMELRRQKDLMRQQQLQPQQQYHQLIHHNPINNSNNTMMFDSSNGDDYLIHQQIGPDFRQLI